MFFHFYVANMELNTVHKELCKVLTRDQSYKDEKGREVPASTELRSE